MKSTKALLGARIKELRKKCKLSQEQLSEKIGVDPKHVSRLEVGSSYPSIDTLEKIATSLGVDILDLFDYNHLDSRKVVAQEIQRLTSGAEDQKLREILRVIKAILK